MDKKRRLYEVKIDEEDSNVSAIAIVKDPAIQEGFLAFSNEELKIKSKDNLSLETFSVGVKERMELIGSALVPDKAISRRDEKTGEIFYVTFNAEEIRKASQNFARSNRNLSINLEHDPKRKASAFVTQTYIVDRQLGINPPIGMDHLPDGTWIVGMKVEDKGLWEDIKRRDFTGYSVEGFFEWIVDKNEDFQDQVDKMLEADEFIYAEYLSMKTELSKLNTNKLYKKKTIIMKKELFAKFNQLRKNIVFNIVTLDPNDVEITAREVGAEVFMNTDKGRVKLEDGTYKVDDFEFVCKNGLIESIGVEMEGIEEEAIVAVEEEIVAVDERVDELERKIDDVLELVEEGFKAMFSALKGVEGSNANSKTTAKNSNTRFSAAKSLFEKK